MSSPENQQSQQPRWNWAPPPPPPPNDLGASKVILIIVGLLVGTGLLFVGFIFGVGTAVAFNLPDEPRDDILALEPSENPLAWQENDSAQKPGEVGAIGETSTWDDGLQVTVTALEERQPIDISPDIDLLWGDTAIVIATVEVTNGTEEPLDREHGLFLVTGTYGLADTEAERVFDDEALPDVSEVIPPGGTATGKYGFSVPPDKTDEFRIEVMPTLTHDPATWQGAAE